MTWEQLLNLPPLRDAHGTIVLEEIDEDTRTATFRVHGRRSLTATVADGKLTFDGAVPPVLQAALAPPAVGRFVAARSWR